MTVHAEIAVHKSAYGAIRDRGEFNAPLPLRQPWSREVVRHSMRQIAVPAVFANTGACFSLNHTYQLAYLYSLVVYLYKRS
jgi:hypothetical protein